MAEHSTNPGGQCDEMKRFSILLPEYIKRLEQVEELKNLSTILPELIKRLEKVEEKQELQDKTINELVTSHAETKVYVKLILEKMESLEGNMATYIRQAMTDAMTERMTDRKLDYQERKDSSQERQATTGQYIGLIKYVIGGTIGALIGGGVAWLSRGGM